MKVKLPNGQIGNFPDDMPHEQIESVLQKQFGAPEPQAPEQGFLNKLPRNIAAGATRGIAGLANIPYELAKITGTRQQISPEEQQMMKAIGETQRPVQIPEGFAEKVPHVGEHDYSKMFGITGEPTATDEAIQFGTEFALPLGGAAKVGAKAVSAVAKKIPAMTAKGITKEVIKGRNTVKGEYSALYNKLFKDAENKGVALAEKPEFDSKLIEKNSQKKFHTSLKEYNETPTLENAHKAQSDMGALQRALEKTDAISGLTSSQFKVLREVTKAKDGIRSGMFPKNPELSDKYGEITKGYREDVIPYSTNKALNAYRKGELSEKKLIQRLMNNDKFMNEVGDKHPGFKVYKPLRNATDAVKHNMIKSLLYGIGAGEAYKLLS